MPAETPYVADVEKAAIVAVHIVRGQEFTLNLTLAVPVQIVELSREL